MTDPTMVHLHACLAQQAETVTHVCGTRQIPSLEQGCGVVEMGEGPGKVSRRSVRGRDATVRFCLMFVFLCVRDTRLAAFLLRGMYFCVMKLVMKLVGIGSLYSLSTTPMGSVVR